MPPNTSPESPPPNKGMKKKQWVLPILHPAALLQLLPWQQQQEDFRQTDPEAFAVFIRKIKHVPVTQRLRSPLFPPSDQRTRRALDQCIVPAQHSCCAPEPRAGEALALGFRSPLRCQKPIQSPSPHPPSSQKERSNQLQWGELQTERGGQLSPAIPPTIAQACR